MSDRTAMPIFNPQLWLRLAYMVLLSVLATAARMVLLVVIALQFIWVAVSASDNPNLRRFGDSVASWLYSAVRYLTFNSDAKPFPFDEWPEPKASDGFSLHRDEDEIAEGEFVAADEQPVAPDSDPRD
jgi:hypothetical protein